MAKMSSRERLLTALKGDEPDRLPCSPMMMRWVRYHEGCTCPRHQLKVAEEFGLDPILLYGMYVWQSVSNDYIYAPAGGYNYSAVGQFGDLPGVNVELKVENGREQVIFERTFHTPAGDLHDVIHWARPNLGFGDGPNPHREEPLVKGLEDLERLKFLFPQPRRDLLADIPLYLEDIGDRGLVAAADCTHAGCWGAEVLRLDDLLIAEIENPELIEGICRMTQDVHLRNLRAMLEEGLGVVYDSWFQAGPSTGRSPASYRRFFLPLIKETVDLAHEYDAIFLYQDDGKMKDIIPMLVEAGVDVVSGLQPPDVGDVVLREVKQEFGDRVALLGGLDPCYTFDMGSADTVRAAVRQAVEDAATGGGYVLGTAEAVDPTQTEAGTLRALVAAAREFGAY